MPSPDTELQPALTIDGRCTECGWRDQWQRGLAIPGPVCPYGRALADVFSRAVIAGRFGREESVSEAHAAYAEHVAEPPRPMVIWTRWDGKEL